MTVSARASDDSRHGTPSVTCSDATSGAMLQMRTSYDGRPSGPRTPRLPIPSIDSPYQKSQESSWTGNASGAREERLEVLDARLLCRGHLLIDDVPGARVPLPHRGVQRGGRPVESRPWRQHQPPPSVSFTEPLRLNTVPPSARASTTASSISSNGSGVETLQSEPIASRAPADSRPRLAFSSCQ